MTETYGLDAALKWANAYRWLRNRGFPMLGYMRNMISMLEEIERLKARDH